MKKDIKVLKRQNLERLNKLRNINKILELEEFQQAWARATLQETQTLEATILLGRVNELRHWLKTKLELTLDDMTLEELRSLARKHSIPYYGRMTKITLVWELQDAIDSDARRNDASVPMGQD